MYDQTASIASTKSVEQRTKGKKKGESVDYLLQNTDKALKRKILR